MFSVIAEHLADSGWPTTEEELRRFQESLATKSPRPLQFTATAATIGACFVCFERGRSGIGKRGDPGWAGAATTRSGRLVGTATVEGRAGAHYEAGLLALREGALLEAAVSALPQKPDVLLVNATGQDHPRRAGLALHIGAILDVPTVGVTHRPLIATGEWPTPGVGSASPLVIEGDVVGMWVRTRSNARPLAVHAGWGTSPEIAVEIVIAAGGGARTPEPLRQARRIARMARAGEKPVSNNADAA